MKRLVVAAALAAGSLLVQPQQAAAQNFEPAMKNGLLVCGYGWDWSFAALQNLNKAARSLCRWKCVFKLESGQLHVNAGARNVAYEERIGLNATRKQVAGHIVAKVSGAGSCDAAVDPRTKR
jgi:hypothetical protein